jgi:antitoxin VapB
LGDSLLGVDRRRWRRRPCGRHGCSFAARSPTLSDELDRRFFRDRYDTATEAERIYMAAMADLGPGSHTSSDIAAGMGLTVKTASVRRDGLLKKGLIYSRVDTELDFTVPQFATFIERIHPFDATAAAARTTTAQEPPSDLARGRIFTAILNLPMPLNIKDPEADTLARELAQATGETITQAVTVAVKERLERLRTGRRPRRLADELDEIALRCASLPVLDERSEEEILGYGADGLPR